MFYLEKYSSFGIENVYTAHSIVRNQYVSVTAIYGNVDRFLKCIVCECSYGLSRCGHFCYSLRSPVDND